MILSNTAVEIRHNTFTLGRIVLDFYRDFPSTLLGNIHFRSDVYRSGLVSPIEKHPFFVRYCPA
jgi:hypothetical protein